MADQQVVHITPEEIINFVLEEMEAGMCPSFYSNLVPSIYEVYLYIDDLERLRPLEQRIKDEAAAALTEKLSGFNKATRPKLKLPGKPCGLAEIAKFPIVTFSRNTQPYIVLREMFARAGLPVTIHASASLATVVRMALDGIGIAVIPPAILDNVAAPGKLRAVKTTARLPSLNFVVSWPAAPDSFAAQKVAGIAVEVAKESG